MIDIATEHIIPLCEVPSNPPFGRGGKSVHQSTVFRWCQPGCKGIRLEFLQCGNTRVTSIEALQRFFEKLTARAGGEPGGTFREDQSSTDAGDEKSQR